MTTEGAPRIAYLSDVEGQWAKVATFVEGNPWVSLDGQGRIDVAEGALFVFGGDAVDRGPDGMRVVRALVEAKARQPGRVVLLAGNRDINKLRLARELCGHPPEGAPEAARRAGPGALLRWIFASTMGARAAFEHRRTELVASGRDASDDAVAQSYLDDLGPSGALRAFLGAAQLAHRSGATLFLHGGLTERSLGVVPGVAHRIDDVDAWVAALNRFYVDQIGAFTGGDPASPAPPAWAPLVRYQAPIAGTRANDGSVVYARQADEAGNAWLPGAPVIAALRRASIERLVVGHTPSGDSPAVLRGDDFELVLADNSYGRVETGSQVLFEGDETRVAGCVELDDGSRCAVRFALAGGERGPIGRVDAATGRLVKGRLVDGRYLLFRGLAGHRVEQIAVGERDVRGLSLVAPPLAG